MWWQLPVAQAPTLTPIAHQLGFEFYPGNKGSSLMIKEALFVYWEGFSKEFTRVHNLFKLWDQAHILNPVFPVFACKGLMFSQVFLSILELSWFLLLLSNIFAKFNFRTSKCI